MEGEREEEGGGIRREKCNEQMLCSSSKVLVNVEIERL